MNKDEKYFEIKVSAKAPQGYKPRSMSLKGLGVTNKRNGRVLLEQKALALYKESLESANPGIDFKYSVIALSIPVNFLVVECEDTKKETTEEDKT